MTTESKVVLGIAAATLAGLAIGLLVAPASGEKTISQIRKQTNKLANRLVDVLEYGKSTVSENVEEAKDKVKDAYHEAKGMAKSEVNRVKNQVEDMA